VDADNVDIGVLVNNVGYLGDHPKPFLDARKDEIVDMININCFAATILCHDFLPLMKGREKGLIINISSILSAQTLPIMGVYCATKHFLSALTKVLQLETKGSGVVIQDLIPGVVKTEMTKTVIEGMRMVPTAEEFVRSAVRTAGLATRTCGYWFHSFQGRFILPDWLTDMIMSSISKKTYKKILEDKKIKSN